MKLVVVSPENDRADEHVVLDAMFNAGLERYHVRKPRASRAELAHWIERVVPRWRNRLVLHQHPDLVEVYQLGGRHWRDDGSAIATGGGWTSRSCHDLATLRASLGIYDSVFFGPIFASISKPGYGPKNQRIGEALGAVLHTRTTAERRTSVIAIGGVTVALLPRVRAFGFDGVAVLGAVWETPDPIAAFQSLGRSKFIGDSVDATSVGAIAHKSTPAGLIVSS